MPISGKNEIIHEEGNDKNAFVVSFTNGALEQLEDLKGFFKRADLNEVIKLGVSFLQHAKEQQEAGDKNTPA